MEQITNNKQNKIDAVSEASREVYDAIENQMMLEVNLTLIEGVENPKTWENNQRAKKKALASKLIKKASEAKEVLNELTKKTEKVIDSELDIDNNTPTNLLVYSALAYHEISINRIKDTESKLNSQRMKTEISNQFIKPLFDYDDLYNSILKQTQKGIQEGLRIQYRNGHKVGYKEYMEMNVRTRVQNDIATMTVKSGRDAHVVFYLCDFYGDCAPDHADYQGKYYFDEAWQSFGLDEETTEKVSNYIADNKLLSTEFVMENDEIRLTRRPNCRHNLNPVTIEQVLGNTAIDLAKQLNLHRGSFKSDKHDITQEQRLNERMIRKYKARRDQNIELNKKEPSDRLKNMIADDKALVRDWQLRQRKLLKENSFLERDYRRETRNILVQDLGVKYNL